MTPILCLLNPRIRNFRVKSCLKRCGTASQSHRQVVDDRRYGLPNRQRPNTLRIERHYDGIPWAEFRPDCERPEPTGNAGRDTTVPIGGARRRFAFPNPPF